MSAINTLEHAIDSIIKLTNDLPDGDTKQALETECADCLLAIAKLRHETEKPVYDTETTVHSYKERIGKHC